MTRTAISHQASPRRAARIEGAHQAASNTHQRSERCAKRKLWLFA
jgi:hypothetical protein